MTRLHDADRRDFASDNYAGVHPEVLAAIAEANGGHQTAYGEDVYTSRLHEVVVQHFGDQATVFPVFNGTGANVLSLQSVLPRWGAVVCAETAHIHTDENGAPERMGGIKLLTVPTPDGKLTPGARRRRRRGGSATSTAPSRASCRSPSRPSWARCTRPTRCARWRTRRTSTGCGCTSTARGSRTRPRASACRCASSPPTPASTSCRSAAPRTACCTGRPSSCSTPTADGGLTYLRKMDMQLASKMRFVSAQLVALYEGDLWLRSARHANAMAARLRAGIEDLPGVQVTRPTQANGVFVDLPARRRGRPAPTVAVLRLDRRDR